MKEEELKSIIITGASGFVGRHLLEIAKEEYNIYAFARKNQARTGVPQHANINWMLVDIARKDDLADVIDYIKNKDEIEFIIHLAAYYDFGNEPNPEYERTNVNGTRMLLEHARELGIKRFIFASSIAASEFPRSEGPMTEKTPLDATFPYAKSKKTGEEILQEYSNHFPCVSVRFAAVFSDWCEYGPLYMFIKTWFTSRLKSHIIAGKGTTAVPYIHVKCVARMMMQIMEQTDSLKQFDVFIASPFGTTSHNELFRMSTQLYFSQARNPFHIPKVVAQFGVCFLDILGRISGSRPFERPWMIKYIDTEMVADSSYTCETLNWRPHYRRRIERRLIYLITHMKSFPAQWQRMNILALHSSEKEFDRPNLKVVQAMKTYQNEIIEKIISHFLDPGNAAKFKAYQSLNDPIKVKWYIEIVFNLLLTTVHSGDRFPLVNYACNLSNMRYNEGVSVSELCNAFKATGDIIAFELLSRSEIQGLEMLVHDSIQLTMQLTMDAAEDTYESLTAMRKPNSPGNPEKH